MTGPRHQGRAGGGSGSKSSFMSTSVTTRAESYLTPGTPYDNPALSPEPEAAMVRWYALLTISLAMGSARADDWPQWMGPKRDNVWREEGIIEKFPAEGAKKLWSAPVAGGYAGPAVAGGKVFVTDYVSSNLTEDIRESGNWDGKETTGIERVLALDEKTGQQLWKYEYAVKYKMSYPAGPRCTPCVVDGKV